MNKLRLITDFINRLVTDKRLSPTHLSLTIALCHAWIDSDYNESYTISRRRMMSLSHIHSIATYHKLIKDLQSFRYIDYKPSYHPTKASSVKLILPDVSSTVINNEQIII